MDEELRKLERKVAEGYATAVDVTRLRAARSRVGIGRVYSVVNGNTYAVALDNLRDSFVDDLVVVQPTIKIDDKRLIRSLTLKEGLIARIVDFNVLLKEDGSARSFDERSVLWKNYLDSCTGILYEPKTSNFKIVPVSLDLLTLKSDFNDAFISDINYASVDGVPLNSSKGVYGSYLSDAQFLRHAAWRAVFNNDKVLMKEYRKVWKEVFKHFRCQAPDSGMGFYVRSNVVETELRALFVYNYYYSIANGVSDLDNNGRFVRVAQT